MTVIALVSSARFGARLFEQTLRDIQPGTLSLGEFFRPGGENIKRIARLLDVDEQEARQRVEMERETLWQEIAARAGGSVFVKVFYWHLGRDSAVWNSLARNARVVHLVRRNLFDAYVSRHLAVSANKWWASSPDEIRGVAARDSIDINPSKAAQFIAERREEIAWFRETAAGKVCHELCFEDLSLSGMTRRALVADALGGGETPDRGDSSGGVAPSIRIKEICNADLIANYRDVAHLDRMYL